MPQIKVLRLLEYSPNNSVTTKSSAARTPLKKDKSDSALVLTMENQEKSKVVAEASVPNGMSCLSISLYGCLPSPSWKPASVTYLGL